MVLALIWSAFPKTGFALLHLAVRVVSWISCALSWSKSNRRLSRVPGRTQLKVRAADAGRPRAAQGHERGSSQVQAGAGGPAWPWGARDGVQGHASAGPSGPNARPILLPAISLGRGFEGAQSNRQQPILDEVTLKQKLLLQEPTPEEANATSMKNL